MKAFFFAITFFASISFVSCEKTNKQEAKTKNPDTVVMKKDTAIQRTDTAGFSK